MECDRDPLDPVTVTVYVPRGVNGVVDTVSADCDDRPEETERLDGFSVAVIVGVEGFTALDRRTVPVKPFVPVTVIVADPEFPATMVSADVEALIVKSPLAPNAIGRSRTAAVTRARYWNFRKFLFKQQSSCLELIE